MISRNIIILVSSVCVALFCLVSWWRKIRVEEVAFEINPGIRKDFVSLLANRPSWMPSVPRIAKRTEDVWVAGFSKKEKKDAFVREIRNWANARIGSSEIGILFHEGAENPPPSRDAKWPPW